MTNREKFKEVFGFDINTESMGCFAYECCDDCPAYELRHCSWYWDEEYQSPKSEEDK